jgi:hypothetical protein
MNAEIVYYVAIGGFVLSVLLFAYHLYVNARERANRAAGVPASISADGTPIATSKAFDLLRTSPLLALGLFFASVVVWIAPQESGVLVFKICGLVFAGYFGYLIDRNIFPYARPDGEDLINWQVDVAWQLRRTAIVIGAMISFAVMA